MTEYLRLLRLLVIAVIGISLRLFLFLNYEFSYDERFSYLYAKERTIIQQIVEPTDDRPPLYYLLVKMTQSVSNNVYAVRFPSLLFSIMTMVITYKLFNLLNNRSGEIAMLLAAVHPLLISSSWQARDYSLLQMLCVLTVYSYLKILKKLSENNKILLIDITILFLAIFLGVLTSYLYYPFILISTAILILIIFSSDLKKKVRNINYKQKFTFISMMFVCFAIAMFYLVQNMLTVFDRSTLFETVFSLEKLSIVILELCSLSGLYMQTLVAWFPYLLLSVAVVSSIASIQFVDSKSNIFVRSFKLFVVSGGLILFIGQLVISEHTAVNLIVPKGFSALIVFAIGIFVICFDFLNQIKIREVNIRLGYIFIFFVLLSSVFHYRIIYHFADKTVEDLMDWEYPLIQEKLLTKIVKIVERFPRDTQVITLPDWDDKIFKYEWEKDDEHASKLSLHNKVWQTIYYNENTEETTRKIHSVIRTHSSQSDLFILVVNSFVKKKILIENKIDSNNKYLGAYNLLMEYCDTKNVAPEIDGSYEILTCSYKQICL